MLDVHHRILPRTGRVHPPTERLLEKAVEVGGAAVLSPEHMVLHSAAHCFRTARSPEPCGRARSAGSAGYLWTGSWISRPSGRGSDSWAWAAPVLRGPICRVVGLDPQSAVVPDVSRPSTALLALMDRLVRGH